MGDFTELFGDAISGAINFMKVMLPVAAVLCFSALLQAARAAQSGDTESLGRRLVAVGIVGASLFLLPTWTHELTLTVDSVITDDLDYDVSATSGKFVDKVIALQNSEDADSGALDFVVSLFTDSGQGLFVSFITAILFIIGHLAAIVQWWGYMFQEAARVFAIAMSPLMLPLFLFQSTRAVAISYVMGLLGIIMWPIGWALAGILTDGMLEAAANNVLYTGIAAVPANILILLIGMMASVWVLFSTFVAPVAISRALTTGVQVGTAMMAGTAGTALGGAVAATRAASAVSGSSSGSGGGGGSDAAQAGLAIAGGANLGGAGSGAGSASSAGVKAAGILSRAK